MQFARRAGAPGDSAADRPAHVGRAAAPRARQANRRSRTHIARCSTWLAIRAQMPSGVPEHG